MLLLLQQGSNASHFLSPICGRILSGGLRDYYKCTGGVILLSIQVGTGRIDVR